MLVGVDEAREPGGVGMPHLRGRHGVRHYLDTPDRRAVGQGQPGKLGVEAPRQAVTNLAERQLDNVLVVLQPLGRARVAGARLGGIGEGTEDRQEVPLDPFQAGPETPPVRGNPMNGENLVTKAGRELPGELFRCHRRSLGSPVVEVLRNHAVTRDPASRPCSPRVFSSRSGAMSWKTSRGTGL